MIDLFKLTELCSPIPSSLKLPAMESDQASMKSGTTPLLESSNMADAESIIPTKGGSRQKKRWRLRLNGWRVGVTISACTAATVLIINIALTIGASARHGVSGGLATIQDGSCKETRNLSLWLHLTINVLSTILLAASNYCMQCLTSPTREEVNQAHARHVWLDIGVPSVRNLRSIAWKRIVLWWLLAFSGIPLHLLYNSAVFSTLAAQEYDIYFGSDAIISGIGLNWTAKASGSDSSSFGALYQNRSIWQNLTNEQCIRAYGQEFVSAHSDVILITSSLNATNPLQSYSDSFTGISDDGQLPYVWLCSGYDNLEDANGDGCDINGLLGQSSDWIIGGFRLASAPYGPATTAPIESCLSKPTEEHCRLQMSLVLMSIVIICNFMKALCMYLILRQQTSPPLVTLGDAIESFLQEGDLTTERMCLAEKYEFAEKGWKESTRPYRRTSHRWFSSASLKRWLTCNILCLTTLIVAGVLLKVGLDNTSLESRAISYLWDLGFGAVTAESMISWNAPGSKGLLLTVLVANSPQALLSFLFLTYNGLYTCMLMADEWSDYAHDRKPLRVTNPIGVQRSTYRLQLPYKYGIPLTILSGTLHWLVSQSLFLARVASFEDGEEDTYGSISTVGYSCIAIITVIILGFIVVALGILNGFRKYRPGMPLVGSCSAAISAACHRPRQDHEAAALPVLWGVVNSQVEGQIGHCCFTSFEVSLPVNGQLYAGQSSDECLLATARDHTMDHKSRKSVAPIG